VKEEILEARTHYRSKLRTIKETICKLETAHVDQHDAERAGIQQRSMSLESKSGKPFFFIPYQEEYVLSIDRDFPIYDRDVENRLNVGNSIITCSVALLTNHTQKTKISLKAFASGRMHALTPTRCHSDAC
jgi:hypothetical protein